jgi:gamma-glutamyl:cysteine ligase YbdK (ATP-grasp superfamily)
MDESGFRYGIEHEVPLLTTTGEFVDFTNTTFERLDAIIAELPMYAADYPGLRIGDLNIRDKRWYIEGFDRFDESGGYRRRLVKGLEVRTPICTSISEAVETFDRDLQLLRAVAVRHGYRLTAVAHNPFAVEFVPDPPLNRWEVAHCTAPEEQTAYIHMLTYGPDVSLSHSSWTVAQTIDIGRKLTYYSPYLVPLSFSSPFYRGRLWDGLSRRTYYRTGARPAVLVFVADPADRLASRPTLTKLARLGSEAGRIEFKAFDACADPQTYGALLALVKGVALSPDLPGRRTVPDPQLHQLSARSGFADATIYAMTGTILAAAEGALSAPDRAWLEPVFQYYRAHRTPAHDLIEEYQSTGDIITTLRRVYGAGETSSPRRGCRRHRP